MERLAATDDERALKVLRKVYAKPPKPPKDYTQYIVASIAWDRLGEDQYLPLWDEWRAKQKKAKDAWLWYRGLDVATVANGPAAGTSDSPPTAARYATTTSSSSRWIAGSSAAMLATRLGDVRRAPADVRRSQGAVVGDNLVDDDLSENPARYLEELMGLS